MKKMLLALFISAIFATSVFAGDTIYIVNFGEDDVGTGIDGTKTAILLNANVVKVVKIYGGVEQGELTTSFDLTMYTDNISGTEQEDIQYIVNNTTTGYLNDDTPVYLTSTATSGNYVYYKITNDGAESDFDFWMLYIPFYKKP